MDTPTRDCGCPDFIVRPRRDVSDWADCFDVRSLPVLGSTAAAIETWREQEDRVDAHLLAADIGNDPLMTLKLLAHVGDLQHRRGRENEAETVTAALVLMGIPPFFNTFGPQTAVDDWLAARPRALAGFRAVMRRSRRAADFALGFAVHRLDRDASTLHAATLLHEIAELLLWLRAPDLALDIAQRQQADPTLRSADAQKAVLNIRLFDLQHALMKRWRLPSLLLNVTDDQRQDQSVQARNVALALRLARHTTQGWDNPAIPDDLHDIAALLNLGLDPTTRLVQEIDRG